MQADELMTFGVISIRPDAPIEEAARLMLHHRISGLPVIDDNGKLVGMVTERDLLPRHDGAAGHDRPRWLEFLLDAGGAIDSRLPELARVRERHNSPTDHRHGEYAGSRDRGAYAAPRHQAGPGRERR